MSSQNKSSLNSEVYQSRRVLLEILKSQNFDTSEHENFSANEVNTMKTNNQLDMLLTKKMETNNTVNDNDNDMKTRIYVKYFLGKSLRPNNIREMIEDLFVVEEILQKSDTLMIVVKDEENDTLIEEVIHIWESEQIFIILMPLKRLQFNILKHELVPFHRVLSEAEKIEVKSKYNIMNDYDFPELSRFDPVAKAIGIRPNQVCEITRPSKTAISSLYRRICVNKSNESKK